MGRAWRWIFVANGTLRAPWRILLFALLFVLLTAVAGALAAAIAGAPAGGKRLLLGQAAPLLGALGAGWIALAVFDRRPPGALGFAWTSRTLREIGAGVAIGGGALAVVAGALAAAGWLVYRPEPGAIGVYLATILFDFVVLAVAAAFEESLFRGYPFQVLAQVIGPLAAMVLTSAVFALAHLRNPNVGWLALVNIFLAGVLLAAAYVRTRSLWFATAVHVGWNWAMASLFDLPVSGLAFFDTPLYEPVEAGPDWVTGGAFGPEGGVSASVAFGLALLAVLRWPGLDEAPEMRALRPLVDRTAVDGGGDRWRK
ncbi:MAG TPA: CPBP family intramembrane glutamic endopeptidase [Longimicrobiales bacterium]